MKYTGLPKLRRVRVHLHHPFGRDTCQEIHRSRGITPRRNKVKARRELLKGWEMEQILTVEVIVHVSLYPGVWKVDFLRGR
jgi:hypothetical protein